MTQRGWTSAARNLAVVVAIVSGVGQAAAAPKEIVLPGDRTFPESITSTLDGTLYVSSLATGGVFRVKPGAEPEVWIKPGAYDTRSTFGVLADEHSHTLWVCSNDVSALGVDGPSQVKGSFLKGFDLSTGEGKVSAALPGAKTLCNDMALAPDGSVLVTNSLAPEILRLAPGAKALDVWKTDPLLSPPTNGAGLDGIAFGTDGNVYVDTFVLGGFFRVAVKNGVAGDVTALKPSRPLVLPDALRSLDSGNAFLLIEGGGRVDRATVADDNVAIETLKDGYLQPTGVTRAGTVAWVADGQLSRLFNKGQSPRLPFKLYAVPLATP